MSHRRKEEEKEVSLPARILVTHTHFYLKILMVINA